jgi:RNA ligase
MERTAMDRQPFTTIRHIDDVTPHISFEIGFVVSRREHYTIIDYVYTMDDTFAHPVARECRGLKFDRDGKIIARPFHKFFNLGEKEQPDQIDWSLPHVVFDKLDGSMVHPAIVNGQLVFMTRMGITPQSQAAQKYASTALLKLSTVMIERGITPMFEFTSPENRIVVAYEKPELTLLAGREIINGQYLTSNELTAIGKEFGVQVVRNMGNIGDIRTFMETTRHEDGIEGYVIAFEDGYRIKLKTDGYVLRHKALAGLKLEKNVIELVAARAVDDVIPLLKPEIAVHLRTYEAKLLSEAAQYASSITAFIDSNREIERKDFAAKTMKEWDSRLRGVVFAALDGRDPYEGIIRLLAAAGHSQTRVDGIRDLFGMSWNVDLLGLTNLDG